MSSSIKGGGRAILSSEAEEMIISLLYDSRQKGNPLLPKDGNGDDDVIPFSDLSNDNKKKQRKKFMKKLVKCHNQQVLAAKFNRLYLESNLNTEVPVESNGKRDEPKSNGNDGIQMCEKVRVDIVEAIFKDGSKSKKTTKSSKPSSNSKKSKDGSSWKEGTRKTIVLLRCTTIKDFMSQCKSKLKMKKPTRVFYVDKDTKLEIDLTKDLSGLLDGAVVYVTSHQEDGKDPSAETKFVEKIYESEIEKELTLADPLESVKKAYNIQRRKFITGKKRKVNLDERPLFTDYLQNLDELSEERSKLPAANYRSDILSSLDKSRVVVICGATGCGKSTQVPQFILEGMKAIQCESEANILVTQPRRVAATSLAMRVSNERISPSPGRDGSEVGYNVRLSKAVSDSTKITYCTIGVLLRRLVIECKDDNAYINETDDSNKDNDEKPDIPLSDVSHVIIDEVHERDLNTDFALTLLKPLLYANEHISIILMSATASAELFLNYFRLSKLNIDPIVFEIPGRNFPVETKWLLDCERLLSRGLVGWKNDNESNVDSKNRLKEGDVNLSLRATVKIDNDFITQLVKLLSKRQLEGKEYVNSVHPKPCGAILIFLPGKGEIQSLKSVLLKDSLLGDIEKCSILQLHSSLTPHEQWLAFQPVKQGKVKVVLATNVAETSITIPDVSIVIDTGRVKECRFNTSSRIKELVTVWTSQASMQQRAGRAGRTGPGICYKLYTEEFANKKMLKQTPPEIVRSPLEELVLQVCLLKEQSGNKGISPLSFLSGAPEPPSESRLSEACNHLLQIGAITLMPGDNERLFRLTPLGYHLSHLPMDVNVGKILIVGCILKCIEPALTIAAALSCSKSCWLSYVPGLDNSKDDARHLHQQIVRNGFGGENWSHGTVKGDLIAIIAAFNSWMSAGKNEIEKRQYANKNALDNNTLLEIKGLRNQFKDILTSSGLWVKTKNVGDNNDDPLLTSCCLVAGLYPNISILVRPSRENKISSGRLVTKDGDSCFASSESFQRQRLKNAQENGRDAYAIYHCKHRTVGTTNDSISNINNSLQRNFLSGINFISRYTILLFGGEIMVQKNYIIVDKWIKFKIADESNEVGKKPATQANAILIQELRNELDNVMLKCIISNESEMECDKVIKVVRKLLSEE